MPYVPENPVPRPALTSSPGRTPSRLPDGLSCSVPGPVGSVAMAWALRGNEPTATVAVTMTDVIASEVRMTPPVEHPRCNLGTIEREHHEERHSANPARLSTAGLRRTS